MDIFSLFLEGLLAFFSPCVLPLVPLYISYISAGYKQEDKRRYWQVFLVTIFFVLGVSLTIVLLAMAVDYIKPLINSYEEIIGLIGGTLIIIFGLHQSGLITINVLNMKLSLADRLNLSDINFLKAFLFGFLFSFAWSPCIGPMLASAIIASTSQDLGSFYILIYGLGFIIPFLITGIFSSFVLNLIKNRRHLFRYVGLIAGLVMIGYGVYMVVEASREIVLLKENKNTVEVGNEFDYELGDQDGNLINLADYQDYYIFLNFSTTWCSYCDLEVADYLAFNKSHEDVKCFYVMSTLTSNTDEENILASINKRGIDVPVLFDNDHYYFNMFSPNGYPYLVIICKNNELLGYVSGLLELENFENIYQEIINY